MIIHWRPCRNDSGEYLVDYTQPEPGVLGIGDIEVDFTDPLIVEYEIPAEISRWVNRAWVTADGLHIELVAFYTAADAGVWETQPYRGAVPEDWGDREALSWRDYDPRE